MTWDDYNKLMEIKTIAPNFDFKLNQKLQAKQI